jgi:hypothetical protein
MEFIISFLANAFAGLLGGLLVWGFQQKYLNKKEKERENKIQQEHNEAIEKLKIITVPTYDKIITGVAIWSLKPGASIELMRNLLGVPLRYRSDEHSVFDKTEEGGYKNGSNMYHSYLYIFKNASVKICSSDNLIITAITVFAEDILEIPALNYVISEADNENRLGVIKVTENMVKRCNRHEYISTRMDSRFALRIWVPFNLYFNYTCFGFSSGSSSNYFESKDPGIFIGEPVWGLCLSSNEDAFYIYFLETR